ncbi:hypothetical protein NQ318_002109, partial [Aromia moschata]
MNKTEKRNYENFLNDFLARSRMSSQQSPSSHYYVQHTGTGSRRIMPRSGSDQHLPQTEYPEYTSITQAGRHSLLRSSLKSGSTLSRYNQRFVDQAAVAAQLAQSKYGAAGGQYGASGTMRRARGSLDYSSDTEATSGSRGYYYYREMVYLTEMHKITILQMVGYGDRTRTQVEVVRLFLEKYPALPPISQGTVSKIEKQFRERMELYIEFKKERRRGGGNNANPPCTYEFLTAFRRANVIASPNQGTSAVPHSTIPTLGRQNSLTSTDMTTKFNSLPRDTRGSTRLAMNKRFGDRSVSLLQDESDGALSAPEMPSIRRDRETYTKIREDIADNFVYFIIDEATDACRRSVANFLIGALKSDTASDSHPNLPWEPCLNTDVYRLYRRRLPSSPSVFSSDEYRQWLSRTPSTSAIYEQIRASRDVLNQQRAARFTYSAENIHDALKNMESGLYSSYGRPGTTATLDRHFTRSQQPTIPARSLSTQHITSSTSALSSSRSPSMRRMRQLLDLDSVRAGAAPSPVPTPSGTLPRGQRQLDINPAEFLKYKIDKPGMVGATSITGLSSLAMGTDTMTSSDEPVNGMLWVHLLAGRGLRASTGTSAATTPVTPSGASPSISGTTGLRDLYCVLECDRVHKARTVVRTGDLVFDWDESFELDLVNNRELDLLIYSWDPQYRHKLCYKGSVYLPTLLKSGPIHQLALKIEPRGTLYLRLRHTDSHSLYRRRGLSTLTLSRTTPLFGVDLETVVNRESKTGGVPGGVATGLVSSTQHNIPIIIKRCVEEVERRGLDIIGLYRLCGSATKKRILREAFERNSRSVDLSPDNVPDINVITGVLKDYLRELPEPLFTKCLYQMMVDALGVCLPDDPEGNAKLMFSILDCLPRINRASKVTVATLIFLMDHLALVVSASDRNKMSAQNLATALAPPLMLHSSESMTPTAAVKLPELDYQQPINVLKYLLQIWPTPKHHSDRSARQATRAAWRQSQCVSSGSAGGSRAVSALSGSVSSSSSLSSLGPARPTATGPITPDTRKPTSPAGRSVWTRLLLQLRRTAQTARPFQIFERPPEQSAVTEPLSSGVEGATRGLKAAMAVVDASSCS